MRARLEKINRHLAKELEVQQLRNKIQSEVRPRAAEQSEYYLREQMKAIQKELGEQDERAARRRRLEKEDRRSRHARRSEKGSAQGIGTAFTYVSDGSGLFADPELRRVAGRAALGEDFGAEIEIPKAKEILDADHYDLKK